MKPLVKICSLSMLLLWSLSAFATHHDHYKVGEPLDLKPDKPDTSLSDACKKSVPFPTRKAKNPAPGAETNLPPPLFEAMRDCPVDKRYHPRPFIEKEKETKRPVVLNFRERVIKNPKQPVVVVIPVVPVPNVNIDIPTINVPFNIVVVTVRPKIVVPYDIHVDPVDVALHVVTPDIDVGSVGPVGSIKLDPVTNNITVPGHVGPVPPVGSAIVIDSKLTGIKNIGPVGPVAAVQHIHGPQLHIGPVGPVGSISCPSCNAVGPDINKTIQGVAVVLPPAVKGPFIGLKPLTPVINVPGPGLIKSPHNEYFVNFYFYKDPGIRINQILLGN